MIWGIFLEVEKKRTFRFIAMCVDVARNDQHVDEERNEEDNFSGLIDRWTV